MTQNYQSNLMVNTSHAAIYCMVNFLIAFGKHIDFIIILSNVILEVSLTTFTPYAYYTRSEDQMKNTVFEAIV